MYAYDCWYLTECNISWQNFCYNYRHLTLAILYMCIFYCWCCTWHCSHIQPTTQSDWTELKTVHIIILGATEWYPQILGFTVHHKVIIMKMSTHGWFQSLSHEQHQNNAQKYTSGLNDYKGVWFQGLAMLWHEDWTLWDSQWWQDASTSPLMEPSCSNPTLQVTCISCSWMSQMMKVSRVVSTTSGSSFQAKVHTLVVLWCVT